MTWTALAAASLVLGAALVVVLALFEIAFFSSSEVAVRVLAEHTDESDSLRESLSDPLVVLVPSRLGLAAVAVASWLVAERASGPFLAAAAPGAFGLAWIALRELLPATVLLQDPERVLKRVLPWFRRWERLAAPVAVPLRRALRRSFPVPGEPDDDATEAEVEAFLRTGAEEGILEDDETDMVRGVLELGDTVVREVMTPRPRVVSLGCRATVGEARRLVAEGRHHRLPVFDESDRPVGIVNVVDLLSPGADEELGAYVQPVRTAPETQPADELLRDFQKDKQTFAAVVDEHGSVSGIVTLRDISEEVVGEVRDDEGAPGADFVVEGECRVRARGAAQLDAVNRESQLDIPDSLRGAPLDTVGGFVVAAFGRIPRPDEVAEHGGLRIEVLAANERSVELVRVTRRSPAA